MEKTCRVWVTKYALTNGIFVADATISDDGKTVRVSDHGTVYFHGREWYRTEEEAIERAEEMCRATVLRLEQRIRKLKSLTFGTVEEWEITRSYCS